MSHFPVGFLIVFADKAFGQVNDAKKLIIVAAVNYAEILVIVAALPLALRVDISGWSTCSTDEIRKSVHTYI